MKRALCFASLACRLGLGALFVYAAWHKILSPGSFAHEINNYKILPVALVNPMAIFLPWLELFCGLALIVNRGAKGAAALVTLLMATFTLAVVSVVLRHLNISCGCFKTGGSPADWLTVLRDVALTAVAAFVWLRACGKCSWNWRT